MNDTIVCSGFSEKELKEYDMAEIHEMEIHKWIESEKQKHDLGDEAICDWIKKYASTFRKEWLEKHGIDNKN
jgi:hypothetical protein